MDQRTLLAIVLSLVLVVAYQTVMEVYYPPPQEQAESDHPQKPTQTTDQPSANRGDQKAIVAESGAHSVPVETALVAKSNAKAPEYDESSLTSFQNNVVVGKIDRKGAQLAELTFLKHLDALPPGGKPIRYIHKGGSDFFFSETGFLGAGTLPGRSTVWEVASQNSSADASETHLRWRNGQGLDFEKIFSVKKDAYVIEVTDRVVNQSNAAVSLFYFAQFVRVQLTGEAATALPTTVDFQGPTGFLNGERVQHKYEDLVTNDRLENASEGWVGFSDHYFLAAVVPQTPGKKRFYFDYDAPAHRVGAVSAEKKSLEPNQEAIFLTKMFIGPKAIKILENQNLSLERSIDYGWFHFLAVPLVKVLLFFNDFFHNYGVAIIFLTLCIKAIFFPLADKSYRSMNEMKKLQPKVEALRKIYPDDKQKLNQEMMKLYQDNKVNPLGGCLPIVVQIPVFFALYKVLLLSVEMRHAPFIFWIHDLSVMDPYYVLPVLMGISMFVQSKLNPAPADPIQAKVMMFLPLIFTFMFLTFPSGLVLYWLVNNVLSIVQQGYIVKKS